MVKKLKEKLVKAFTYVKTKLKALKDLMLKYRSKVLTYLVPILLLFSYKSGVTLQDRFAYLWEVITRSAPFIFLYGIIAAWFSNNTLFATAISAALLVNCVVGFYYHYKNNTLDLEQFIWKNSEILVAVLLVYLLLTALASPLSGNTVGIIFKSTIEFVTILYPTSKALKNIFILTDGKHPPEFVMKAIYQYEKEGKLKDFFDSLNLRKVSDSREVQN